MNVVAHGYHEECDHDCDCFWCRIARKEQFETITETMEINSKEEDK